MELQHAIINGGILEVRLAGTLDIAGSDQIGLAFNALAGSGTLMLVEMSQVSFLASMGIRLLLTVGKAVLRRRGRIVLLGATPGVLEVLTTTGIDQLIPTRQNRDDALALLTAA